jgi:dihydrofolate synthase/folylpolyglutamate synthase
VRFDTLQDWLDWQQRLHPSAIDLDLERVRAVLAALGPARPRQVLTVGGTNGKGSVTAMLDAMLRAAGYDVGCFTSPHLRRYNERIRIGGLEVDDGALMECFDRIDRARGDTSLTFFEWNTLAALLAFERAGVDAAVLEVGLGGRLDAVNAVDADVAAVVSVGLDHMEWLGPTVEHIGREKAGIFRPGRVAIFGSRRAPDSIGEVATRIGARLRRLGTDFDFVERPDGWDYISTRARRPDLPLPGIPGAVQLGNAATALAMLEAAEPALLVPDDAVKSGLKRVRLAGRFQVVEGEPQWVLDVAHNPDAARVLGEELAARPVAGRTRAVCGILGDKDVAGIGRALAGAVQDWCAVRLDGPRALPEAELAARLEAAVGRPVACAPSVAAACAGTLARSAPGDRIVVFGSFLTVGAALEWLDLPT